jgi:integrase
MPAYKDTKKNTWYAKFRYNDWQGNRKETTKRGFSTRREAKEYEEEFKRKAASNPKMSLSSLYEIYIADRRKNIKKWSADSIDYNFQRYILPLLGRLSISDITPNTIRHWQNELASRVTSKGKPLSPMTLKNINRKLSALLNFGVKFYGLRNNPMQVTGSQGHYSRRVEFWTKEEYDTFLNAVKSPVDAVLYQTLYYTGMRIGEALALTQSDIDYVTNQISVTKTLSQHGDITPPKTQSSIRTITLPENIAKDIRDMNNNLSYDSEQLFPVSYQAALRHFHNAVNISGVRPLNIHCLRHAHVSCLIANGVPVTAIAKRLGHSSAQITMSVYAHAYDDSDKAIADLLSHL